MYAQNKPNQPTPGNSVSCKPHHERASYHEAIVPIKRTSKITEQMFHGIVMKRSNGMKIRQLMPGISHKIMSQGIPHGSHHVNKLNGNIVKMY